MVVFQLSFLTFLLISKRTCVFLKVVWQREQLMYNCCDNSVFLCLKLSCCLWCHFSDLGQKSHYTVHSRYLAITFSTVPHNGHTISRPSGRGMLCLLSMQSLSYVFPVLLMTCIQYRVTSDCDISTVYCNMNDSDDAFRNDLFRTGRSNRTPFLTWLNFNPGIDK